MSESANVIGIERQAEEPRGLRAGIIDELGRLPAGALVTEEALARMLGRCVASVKRAVNRGELPPPARLCGECLWTADVLLAHLRRRMEDAAKDAARTRERIAGLRP